MLSVLYSVQLLEIYDYFMYLFSRRDWCGTGTYAETLKNAKNETLKSVRSLWDAFENGCANYKRIIATKLRVSDRIREIELRTEYVGIIYFFSTYFERQRDVFVTEPIRRRSHVKFRVCGPSVLEPGTT